MLRRRSSRLSPFSSSNKSKTSNQPPPKPGRTLVLSSTSSTSDLSNPLYYSSSDSNPFTIDTAFPCEPLFHDIYLPSEYDSELRAPLPILIEDQPQFDLQPRGRTVHFNMDPEQYDFSSSEDEDDILNSYYPTPDTGFLATQVTIIYSGKAKMIDIFPLRDSFKLPPPLPPQSVSRSSSSSTRDNSISLSSRFSDSDSRPSPASSISEYSNVVCETIPENSPIKVQSFPDVDMKPFRRGHRRNMSSASALSSDNTKQPEISILELRSSSNSSLSKLDAPMTRWEGPPRITSFLSDSSSPGVEESQHHFDY